MPLRIDDARMMAASVPSGVSPTEWNDLAIRFGEVHAAVASDRSAGRYGFMELDAQAAETKRVLDYAAHAPMRYTDVVVLGIGGSALGAIALRSAFGAYDDTPRLHVVDNVDPHTFKALLARLAFDRTLWIVVSKSGATVETLAQYAIVRHVLVAGGLSIARHVVFVTDPVAGPLRAIALDEGIPAFDVPPNVGGRFSVLTPVGTLPAAFAGYDVGAIVAGAQAMLDRCNTPALADNPAGLLATLLWRAHQRAGQSTHVFMPYSDPLRDVAPWFVQLWAESLGKTDADGLPAGPTPLAARGATDQHSLLQLLMEGPADKVVCFLRVANHARDLMVPKSEIVPDAVAFMRGRSLGELLDAEAGATARALVSAGRPSLTITVDGVDAYSIGELLMFLMIATVYAGAMYRVDPLGQPGVELAKRLAREALERSTQ
ncbi:MAG: glucose-6-phosphate isomerase [Gemmatimonadetes bacterium]|nr:glucose-6-phosphate isomerase [Gemmatimonadota bacterium]